MRYPDTSWLTKMMSNSTHGEVIAQAGCDLGEGAGGAGSDEDDVCPAPQFDVQDGIADGVYPLCKVRGRRAWYERRLGTNGGGDAHRPFIVIRPYARAGVLDVCGVKEGEGPFRGDDFDFDVAVLRGWVCVRAPGGQGENTDFEEVLYDEGGLYGCNAASRDEEDMRVVGRALELGDELAGHDGGAEIGMSRYGAVGLV